ncbi:Putative peptidase U35, phage prohead HK97 (fragment) [Candidatus Defluviicoccus seviourii]|uniref:Peptidase U35, phage prohead HK97 n=2 Tax=root TaxID=1 RepID=A0A564WF37_9PROT
MNTAQHFAMLPVAPKREIHAALVEHLVSKARGRPPKGEARQYQHLHLADVARLAAGDSARQMDLDQLLSVTFSAGSHSTSDFPGLLQDAANKVLLETLEAAPPSYRAWAQRRQFRDFKAHKFLRVGDFPAFQAVPEPATMKLGTVDESRETVTLVSYTSGISFTREALINDDLGALTAIGNSIATRAAATEGELSYSLLATNPVMSDGEALFSEAHGNLAASGSALDVTSLAAGRKAMRQQVHGTMLLNLSPRFLVCGPAYETDGDRVLAEITPNSAANVNPFSGKLELVVDANITGNAWYLFADPAAWPSIVYGHLRNLESAEVWVTRNANTRALDIHAGLDFAVGAIDYRGAYCNPGA